MSLEQALLDNTETMKRLIVVMSTAAEAGALTAPTAAPAAPAAPKTRAKKTDVAAAAGEAAGTPPAGDAKELINHGGEGVHGVVEGDPVGTHYYVIEKHKTAAAVRPGEVIPSIEGTIEVSPAEYLAAKERFAGNLVAASPAAAPTPSPAPAPASSTPSAEPASSTPPAASPAAGVTLQAITEKLMALHKIKGNPAIAPFLTKFSAASVKLLPVTQEVFDAATAALDEAEGKAPATAVNLF